jgi:hypothetical protein
VHMMNLLELYMAKWWEVSNVREAASFFRALPSLLPENSILYLEGGEHSKAFRSFLKTRSLEPQVRIPLSSVFPKPYFIHLPLLNDTVSELARMADSLAEPEICTHLHCYYMENILLSWCDAFHDPLMVSHSISESAVGSFAAQLSAEYRMAQSAQGV